MNRFLMAVVAASALVLGGCGFHLRNALTLPDDLEPVRVLSTTRYSPLVDALEQALVRAGAVIAEPDATTGVATLRVLSEQWATTPISVDQFGRAQEFSLRYAVVFRLQRGNGSDLVPQQVIEMSRDYLASPEDLTGADSERELLSREMRREMTASVIRRIDAVTRQTLGQ